MKSPSILLSIVAAVAMTFGISTSTVHAQVCAGDVNGDHVVNGADLAILMGNWGDCAGPTWATVLEWAPDATVVTDANLRAAIVASGFAWRIRDNSSNIEMLLIPAGTFMMGCSGSTWFVCSANENPKHQVTLTQAFYMGRYEVTQAQWTAKMGSNPSYFVEGNGYPGSFARPVEQVSWNMIASGPTSFMSLTGLRLPTEAEWEYAYRAGTTTAFHSYPAQPTGFNNDALLVNIAWYDNYSGSQTHAVGGKYANALGLHDMAGNVSELCQDWYGLYSSGSVNNPTGPTTGSSRLLRGGAWGYSSLSCRASSRLSLTPDEVWYHWGFRVARTPAVEVCAGDINNDHVVNGADLGILLGNWGDCAGPTGTTVLAWEPDAAVVTDANLRAAIVASGFAWRIRDNSSNIEMLLVPPGTFTMGCSASTLYGCFPDESPTHQVTMTQAFYMGRYEVTQAQWTAKMLSNPSWFQGQSDSPSRPVDNVSWDMIQGFNSATGLRLPTEAEWEYAYRAGTTTAFHSYPAQPTGFNEDTLLGNIAWYSSNSGNQTHAVGGKFANALGLHDMSGNVFEWCQDWYGDTYYASSPLTNPTGPETGSYRLMRGGGWNNYFSYFCRASERANDSPDEVWYNYGFRVARTP